MRALTDAALIDAMRAGIPESWAEFDARYRPLLERYAARVGIPRWEWSVCITEVLDDEALRLIERAGQVPRHLSAYLVRAVRNRFLELKRAAQRRERRYAYAAHPEATGDGAIDLAMSEHARRSTHPPRVAEENVSGPSPVARFAATLASRLTIDERQMLAWVSEGVPHRVIAGWLGITREAAKKRIARLCRRLRAIAEQETARLPVAERREIERLMRRALTPERSHSGESDDG
jgi:DNA-directed RNA polymerase specialized sigma24 family protein